MEDSIKKIVNLGIGTAKALEETFSDTIRHAGDKINDLVKRGEAADDEKSKQLKSAIENLNQSLQDFQQKSRQISESFVNALQEIDLTGKKKIDQLNEKIEEISALLEKLQKEQGKPEENKEK